MGLGGRRRCSGLRSKAGRRCCCCCCCCCTGLAGAGVTTDSFDPSCEMDGGDIGSGDNEDRERLKALNIRKAVGGCAGPSPPAPATADVPAALPVCPSTLGVPGSGSGLPDGVNCRIISSAWGDSNTGEFTNWRSCTRRPHVGGASARQRACAMSPQSPHVTAFFLTVCCVHIPQRTASYKKKRSIQHEPLSTAQTT